MERKTKKRNRFIKTEHMAVVTGEICEQLYQKSIAAVYDYCNKIKMPYSPCKPCEADTPTIVRRESDTCALCGSGKEIQERY